MEVVSVIAGQEHFFKAAAIDRGLPRDAMEITHTLVDLHGAWSDVAQTTIRQLGLDQNGIRWIESPHPQVLNYLSSSTARYVGAVLDEVEPDQVLIYGDLPGSASAAIGTYMAEKRHPFIHNESGLRNGDPHDLEEDSRLIIDAVAHGHTVHLEDAYAQFAADQYINTDNVFLGINPVTAILDLHVPYAQRPHIPGLDMDQPYIVSTIHREKTLLNNEHVFATRLSERSRITGGFPQIGDGEQEALPDMLNALTAISSDMPVVFIQYESTKRALARLDWQPDSENIIYIDPLSFHEYLGLLRESRGVVTDSSGVLVEAAHLGKPGVVLRDSTHCKDALTDTTRIGGVRFDEIMKSYDELRLEYARERDPSYEPNIQHVETKLQQLGRFLVETARGRDMHWLGKMAVKSPWLFRLRQAKEGTPLLKPQQCGS